jgi:predicted HAD superfamily Cof-like phosphohydrolase
MRRHVQQVRNFMSLAGQELPPKPVVPDEATRLLRAKLILEEAMETIRALGVDVRYPVPSGGSVASYSELVLQDHGFVFGACFPVDLIQVADGVADLTVVATGTALACGIDPEPIQELVDESNLKKFGPGSYRREDGKWMKPADWVSPPIKAELLRQTYR